ncbi:uncharacterized protein J8A68_005795 [[Candida] subhashii]|uniref:Uncharacterized protein n=1 Tax=[Candida] subhashii TaxID=561895 RepID=A0A8J5UDX6_9ASCO|nr:uncharacterized protein J8A68_005795 [[Candida] subhashii]KAG7660678.1 hypothetical protein J8A68_005795 [[Candida] subhashii]
MKPYSLLILLYLAKTLAVVPDHRDLDKPILKVSTRNYNKQIIIEALQDVANKVTLSPSNLSRFQSWTIESERTCIENSNIKYFLRTIKLTDKIFEASECRTNTNPNFQSILQPSPNIHNLLLRNPDPVDSQLITNLMDHFGHYEQFKDYKFNDFNNLNYDLQCVIDYQELMQVGFKETIIEVTLERKVEVDETCQFKRLNPQFPGFSYDHVPVHLPVNGTFYCHKGKSKTCNRAIAEYKNSRYKLIDS